MGINHLECLVAEWHEYRGYFVRRNLHVGKRANGGYECELDLVCFHPGAKHLVHIEPSMDSNTWEKREERYAKKFAAGRKYIPPLFHGVDIPKHIDQIALFGLGSGKTDRKNIGGGRVMMMPEFLQDITSTLRKKRIEREAIPEQYPLLRTIQFICQHERQIFRVPEQA